MRILSKGYFFTIALTCSILVTSCEPSSWRDSSLSEAIIASDDFLYRDSCEAVIDADIIVFETAPRISENTLHITIIGADNASINIKYGSSYFNQQINCTEIYALELNTLEISNVEEVTVNWNDIEIPNTVLANVNIQYPLYIRQPELNPAYDIDLSDSIAEGLAYMESVELEIDALVILHRANEIYSLSFQEDLSQIFQDRIDVAGTKEAEALNLYSRIINPNSTTTSETLDGLINVDRITMPALYCDETLVSSSLKLIWEDELDKGGYSASHVLFAYKLLMDNQCGVELINTDFLNTALNMLILEIVAEDGLNDLEIEIITFFALLDREDLIKPVWISSIISQQQVNGSWVAYPYFDDSSQHTTALALWLLLDLEYYNQSFGSFIAQH